MIFHIIVIIILLVMFVYISYTSYEGFNTSYNQEKYSPNTDKPIPTALDKTTTYVSPDVNGNCPPDYTRDRNNIDSLCHSKCKSGAKFYSVDGGVQGCSILEMRFPPKNNNGKTTMHFATDKKTSFVSPKSDGSCPENMKLDTNSGLCHTECEDSRATFYGVLGCSLLNTEYRQSKYGTSDDPYPVADDENTKYVSPTSSATCPPNFILNHASGLCHTKCSSGVFNGERTGTNIQGCR